MARKKKGGDLPPTIDDRSEKQKARDARSARKREPDPNPPPAVVEPPEPAQAEQQPLAGAPPIVAASVHSIDEAKAKREALQTAVAKELGPKEPIEFKLSEVEALKFEAAQSRARLERARVVEPLKKAAEAALEREIAALKLKRNEEFKAQLADALKADEPFQLAGARETLVVNELLDTFEPQAPEGYAVKLIEWESSRIVLEYDPPRRGQRFEWPTTG